MLTKQASGTLRTHCTKPFSQPDAPDCNGAVVCGDVPTCRYVDGFYEGGESEEALTYTASAAAALIAVGPRIGEEGASVLMWSSMGKSYLSRIVLRLRRSLNGKEE